ncbi:hypothetical protein [Micromonospora chersina]|uniref:hypothetical protein n=1 Tax=Micromonospora chersina TaxID=47854 RepID=UPI0037194DC3
MRSPQQKEARRELRDARRISAREVSQGVQRHVLRLDDLARQHGNDAQRRRSTGFPAPRRQTLPLSAALAAVGGFAMPLGIGALNRLITTRTGHRPVGSAR